MLIGHRGAPGHHVEHTWASYRRALDDGVDAVEPDVVMSADGVAVVLHENELSTTTDIAERAEFAALRTERTVDGVPRSGWFAEDLTVDQLRTLRRRERWSHLRPGMDAGEHDPILTLTELIERLDAHDRGAEIALVVELKHSGHLRERGLLLEEEVMRVLAAEPARRVIVESFESAALIRMREVGFTGDMAHLLETTDARRDALHLRPAGGDPFVDPALRGVVTHLSVDKDLLLHDPDLVDVAVERLRERDLGVYTWTLRPENAFLHPLHRTSADSAAHGDYDAEWRRIWNAGVDGVFVDHPALARRSLALALQEDVHHV